MRPFLNFFISSILLLCVGLAHADNNFKEFEQQLSDSVITAKITAKFAKNADLNPLKISVSTKDGIVTLKGNVKDKQTFVDALKLVKVTKGVKAVEADDLEIKQVNTAFTDAYITAKVEAAVLKAKVFDDESIPLVGINASTTNGTVTLSGKVKQDKSIVAIIKRVNAVRGVKKIISKLQVSKDA
ncbi:MULTISPECIES: BON domain-containing protein [Legionella]|uniref:Osmotically inducible protein Y n=1 Tax=Legionella maceachernii TaxID=466 RepID=A0A0W0W3V9_9GAMM|nr:BON domain-containing protein [Legionella maceachernii]KTD27061.1 osmotically inducible protein Y [Legionella maceachernii]SKA04251.1 hyperosmotically inducible protein [Legionella maceachernii]SUP00253.1 Osmotically-inducible protein Y precursor [Legionella maceachernii]